MPTPLHVIVDPGHGGSDMGAVRSSIHESDISLKVAKRLSEILSKDPRFKVTLTRKDDKTTTLEYRAQIAKDKGGHIFISIHVNASKDSRASGVEVYFKNQLPPDEEAMFLANKENHYLGTSLNNEQKNTQTQWLSKKNDLQNILNDLDRNHNTQQSYIISQHFLKNWSARIHKRTRPLRQAPFYLVSEVTMPSVLIELGFLSNPKELQILNTKKFHRKAAENIYNGLVKYKETLDKSS